MRKTESIIRDNRKGVCYICRKVTKTEEHHIFGAANRDLSEKYGLKVFLCPYCHRDNKEGVHGNAKKMEHLHRIGQSAFERDHTRAEFREIFGKNYLEITESQEDEERQQEEMRQQEEQGIIWLKIGIRNSTEECFQHSEHAGRPKDELHWNRRTGRRMDLPLFQG